MTKPTIMAIETEYAGCLFRSRLEARWAVFFDALGIEWQYEPQGFDMDTFRYLPDFFLPHAVAPGRGTWVEVKGDRNNLDVGRLYAAALDLPASPCASADDRAIDGIRLLVLGDIPDRPKPHYALRTSDRRVGLTCAWQHFVFCVDGGIVSLGETLKTRLSGPPDTWPNLDLDPGHLVDPDSEAAYRAARSARFEFGRSGAQL